MSPCKVPESKILHADATIDCVMCSQQLLFFCRWTVQRWGSTTAAMGLTGIRLALLITTW